MLVSFFALNCDKDRSPTIPAETDFSDPLAIEPTAGSWGTWVIESGSAYRPADPGEVPEAELQSVRDNAVTRTAAMMTNIDYWDMGTSRRWNEYLRSLIIQYSTNPPRASRALALVSVAGYDALVASWDAKYSYLRLRPSAFSNPGTVYGTSPVSPSFVAERTAISAAVSEVLKYLYPAAADSIDARYQRAKDADTYSGNHFPSDIAAGEAIGLAVAAEVLNYAATDNSNAIYSGTQLNGAGYWVPTPPANNPNPLEKGCGQWKTWILPNGAAIRPVAPPSYGTPEFDEQLREVWETNQNLTAGRLAIAQFWADGAGTQTPPGHWNEIALTLAENDSLNEPRTARMLALLGTAQADAFISCWDSKYLFWCVRPITEVRAVYNAAWLSPITTPPFPAYPSGHSTTSGAASTLLGFLFPDDAVSLSTMGIEAMNSRLYGGIHFPFDNLVGFSMGSAIATRAIRIALSDGCPAH